ncbi:MAG: phage integrase N-terminal SAM-like domain-containing protein [Betaproteobacteria bacterium]|nr:phage integrase N-terminal SAM-like domain-containing protein [Betaproteobacteria bacterium]MBI2290094.1 phage integrase N-terminal SAM-like domain-containing protein [Betaproteobacteria bacterium]
MSSPRLLDQVHDRLHVKHYSVRTEYTYLQRIRRFIFFHGKKHPRETSFRSSALAFPNAGCGR